MTSVFTIVTLVDYGQTLTIAKNPDEFYEKYNVVMDEHPSTKEVTIYFAGYIVTNYLVLPALAPKTRRMFECGMIGLELGMVSNNCSLGIRVSLPFH